MRADPALSVRRLTKIAAAVMLACAGMGVAAQDDAALLQTLRDDMLFGAAPAVSRAAPSLPGNFKVAEIAVEVERAAGVADGVSRLGVTIELRDGLGELLTSAAVITIETSAGRVELFQAAADLDPETPGVQLRVENGRATFWLLAPARPQDVKLRVTAGAATAVGVVSFLPELRDMIAVGLIEGAIGFGNKGRDEIRPVRIEDGFEQELRNWSRRFSNDRNSAAVRAALFLKGKIRGDALLTLAYDSDKDTYQRLFRDTLPDVWYPVYGDSSIKAFDAQSASKLYVRVDKDKNYLLYGDFVTSANFSPLVGGQSIAPVRVRDLGQYNRTLTGARAHFENASGYGSVFAARDTLRQSVEEYAANGTSGPFSVRNSGGLIGSERVEVVVRDRNNVSVIVRITPLAPLVDYVFEPFSGRILLNRPLPSRDELGNPQSLRISYELDQGGDPFWVAGLDGQLRINSMFEIGGSYVDDRNPLAPYKLMSANASVHIARNTRLVAEFARSEGTYNTGTGVNTALTPGLAGISGDAAGNAMRIALDHDDGTNTARLYAGRSDPEFDNSASSFDGGRGDAGLRMTRRMSESVTVFGEAVRSEDRISDGTRTGAQLGAAFRINERLTLDIAVKHVDENGRAVSPTTVLPGNPSSAVGTNTSPLTPSGGFYGNGINPLNPSTGTAILSPSAGATSSGAGTALEATTLQLGAQYRATDALTLAGEVEHAIDGDEQKRAALGASYQLQERSRLYGRFETQRGLASRYSLNPSDRSTWFVFGADTTYESGTQFYSEYRLRDAIGDPLVARDSQLASGLRNTWQWREGIRFVTGAEYLRVLNGPAQEAVALVGGVDYTADPLWKGLARLEWRRLFDADATPTLDERQDSWLSTFVVARKLSRDWTLLTRNYLLFSDFAATGHRVQDRFQIGAAYRDTLRNRSNVLTKYEFKIERDESALPSPIVGTPDAASKRDVHIVSIIGDWHPTRDWWLTGRAAAKSVDETFSGVNVPRYSAYLLGGRAIVDITERFDVGVLTSVLFSSEGRSRQGAIGLEVGAVVRENLRVSLGYNVTGFRDRDLTGSEYTAQGFFLRLRYKFDEELLKAAEPLFAKRDAN
ncbi:MAG: hypothetical protein M3P99_03150 [Pseudomonadota bacterium]|nr:hypothetical protein [Pseudomonadota bacterium]